MHNIIEVYRSVKEKEIVIRPETNLARWPQLFATRQTPGLSRVIERGDGKVIIGLQITNKGNKVEVGFLIVPDYVILMGLIHMWELNDRPQDEFVAVSVRNFVRQVLGRTPSKLNYQRLEESLKRLKQVPIRWINAFYDSQTGRLETISDKEFNFLQYLEVRKVAYTECQPAFKTFTFKFNDYFLRNLLSDSTKPFLLSEIVKFGSELSVLAYAFFDIVMADKAGWSRRASAFIRDDLQNKADRYKWPANCKVAIKEIIEELDGCRLSTGVLHITMRPTKDKKDWKVVLRKSAPQEAPDAERAVHRPATISELQAQELFVQIATICGREKKNAVWYRQLISYYSPDLIRAALRDTADERREGKILTSNAAFFSWWIQELGEKHGIARIKGQIHAWRESKLSRS